MSTVFFIINNIFLIPFVGCCGPQEVVPVICLVVMRMTPHHQEGPIKPPPPFLLQQKSPKQDPDALIPQVRLLASLSKRDTGRLVSLNEYDVKAVSTSLLYNYLLIVILTSVFYYVCLIVNGLLNNPQLHC